MDKCDKCLKNKESVQSYCFYYGKCTGYQSESVGFREIKETTSYQIVPNPISVNICDDCINAKKRLYIFLEIIFLLLLSILIYFQMYALFLLLMVVSLIIIASILSKKDDIGDRVAISIYRNDLHKKGYNEFFIRSKYNEMNSQTLIDKFNKGDFDDFFKK